MPFEFYALQVRINLEVDSTRIVPRECASPSRIRVKPLSRKKTADVDMENLTRMGTLNERDEVGHSWHSVLHVFRGGEHIGDCSLGNCMSRCVFVCVCVIERGEERERERERE